MKSSILFFFLSLSANIIFATDLKISNIELHIHRDTNYAPRVKVNVEWENAWHNAKNFDGVWLFVKFETLSGRTRHAKIAQAGHQVVHNPMDVKTRFEVGDKQTGLFLTPDQNHRGRVSWTIEIHLDRSNFDNVNVRNLECKVYGIEMVYIPEGSFTLGDPSDAAYQKHALYQVKANGERGLYSINSENQIIEIGKEPNMLYYEINTQIYQGDQQGVLASHFPKGYKAFYCMKYELQQGQYAQFLNSISDSQTHHRANFGGRDYYKNRGSIYFDRKQEIYKAEKPQRPCNYITWDDAMAFADWAGLRPMTELEFTKACRGPERPKPNEFPWGTNSKSALQRGVNLNNDLVMFNGMDESQLTEQNRAIFGASYYWVMDLAGSLWEKVVTIGDEKGRAFKGNHGDGRLTGMGFANEESWPKGFDEGGYGYRGGGYYYHGQNYSDFNPHSPIAFRPYGAWAGGNRSIAYSTRFVRTATP